MTTLADRADRSTPTDRPDLGAPTLPKSDVRLFMWMLISACLSLVASFVLSIDAVELARNPATDLTCNINAVQSCGKVGAAWQASLLGFPNASLGLIAESVVITIAVASLGGVRFPRWFMFSAQVVYTAGLIFAYWLFAQSMFVIHALCPWCLLITLSTTLVFASLTRFNAREGNLLLPPWAQRRAAAFALSGNGSFVVAAWLILLIAGVVARYGAALFA